MSFDSVFYPAAGFTTAQAKELFSNTILIIPSVSVANVPQLAIDLLICTLDMQLVGRLSEDYVYPFSGPRDFPATKPTTNSSTKPSIESESKSEVANSKSFGITTAIEVFTSQKHNLSVIQVRSPTLPGCRNRLINKTLLPFINAFDFSEIVVAGSSNAALSDVIPPPRYKLFYKDSSNNSNQQAATSTSTPSTSSQKHDSLSSRLSKLSITSNSQFPTCSAPEDQDPSKLPESGIVLEALTAIAGAGLKVVAAVLYVFEGDNLYDAQEFASRLAELVEVDNMVGYKKDGKEKSIDWVEPMSWSGVYGKEIPVGLEEGLYS